jgi:hypothetical protein
MRQPTAWERPMTLFPDRERAFEDLFVHGETQRFKALARRNMLIGKWAADRLALRGEEAFDYMHEVRNSPTGPEADLALEERLYQDFMKANVGITHERLRAKFDQFLAQAVADVRNLPG